MDITREEFEAVMESMKDLRYEYIAKSDKAFDEWYKVFRFLLKIQDELKNPKKTKGNQLWIKIK